MVGVLQFGDRYICLFVPAADAVNMIGHLSKHPVAGEDKLLASEHAASNLLSLAAQIALEVTFIIGLIALPLYTWETIC